MHIFRLLPFGLALLLTACAGHQAQHTATPNIEKVSIQEYQVFLADLRASINQGIPREFNRVENERYDRIDNRLHALLEHHESIDSMSENERRELFNLHEDLQALVIGRDQDQVICRRQQTVGTHFQTQKCRTRSEWHNEQEQSRQFLRGMFRHEVIDPADVR